MKTFTGLLSLAIVSGGLLVSMPAKADTAYHRVYRQSVTVTDPFSILDKHQNNALRAEEYKKSNRTESFASLDVNKSGFLTRSEFYGTAMAMRSPTELGMIAPAAGGVATYRTLQYGDIVYRDDPCDTIMHRNDSNCR